MFNEYLAKKILNFLIVVSLLLLIGCGGPVLTRETISLDIFKILPEKGDSTYFVDADIIVTISGERHSANFSADIKSPDLQKYKIYSPIIGDLVSLKLDADSLFLDYEKTKLAVSKSNGFEKLPFFSNYPFSFYMFTRILTGRLPFTAKEIVEEGKYTEGETGSTVRMEKDNFYLKLNFEGRKLNKSYAVITSSDNSAWKLKYSNFKHDRFEKVSFKDEKGNGFILTFKN